MRRVLPIALVVALLGALGAWWLSSSREDGDDARIARERPRQDAVEPRLAGREPPEVAGPSEGITGIPRERSAPVPDPVATPFDAEFVDADTGRMLDVQGNVILGRRPDATVDRVTMAIPSPPPGWLVWDATTWVPEGSVRTKRLHAVVPLRREVPVTVRLVAPPKHPRGPFHVHWQIAGRSDVVARTTDTDVRLEGIPFFPGADLVVAATVDTSPPPSTPNPPRTLQLPSVVTTDSEVVSTDSEEATITVLDAPPQAFVSETRVLPYGPVRPIAITLQVPEPPESGSVSFSSHVETDNDLPYEESYGISDQASGRVRVRVLGRDGRSVPAGVNVRGPTTDAPTDASGEVAFAGVEPGTYPVFLRAVGFVPVRRDAVVRSGEETRVDLVEPEGATVRVEVVDGEGHGCPFAEVYVEQPAAVPWIDLSDDGVHRVDAFTDAEGRRTLRRVEPGRVRVTGIWAGRNNTVEVDAYDGRTVDVRVAVPAPALQGK